MIFPFHRPFNELDRWPPLQAFGHLESGEGSAEATLREGAARLAYWSEEAFADRMVILRSLC